MGGSPARKVVCTAVRQWLYATETGDRAMPGPLERHRHECLSCQAEAVRQRRIVRALADMRRETETAPHDLSAAAGPDDPIPLGQGAASRGHRATRTAIAGAASLAALGIAVALRAKRAS